LTETLAKQRHGMYSPSEIYLSLSNSLQGGNPREKGIPICNQIPEVPALEMTSWAWGHPNATSSLYIFLVIYQPFRNIVDMFHSIFDSVVLRLSARDNLVSIPPTDNQLFVNFALVQIQT
jgi:hypothetical protein